MATRDYTTFRSLDIPFKAPLDGSWDTTPIGDERLHGLTWWQWMLSTSKTLGGSVGNFGNVTQTVTPDGPLTNYDALLGRWITRALGAQTIGGTVDLCLASRSAVQIGLGLTVVWHLHIYVARLNVVTQVWEKVATLLNNYIDATPFTDDATQRFYGLTAPQALTGFTTADGDRVVAEIGLRITNPNISPAAGSNGETVRMNAGTCDPGGVTQADAAVGDVAVTARAGYLDFTHTFVELAGSAPANDACVDAQVVASLPFRSGPVDAEFSADPDRAIWYEWTAPAGLLDVVYFTAQGTNFQAALRVYAGTCGALGAAVAQTSGNNIWVGEAQSLCRFLPVSGTTYRFKVYPAASNSQAGSVNVQIWMREAPQDGDIFVNCQAIACVRDPGSGATSPTMVNLTHDFFNNTPTGSAIDYTLRPIEDQNTGLPHTGLRLFLQLFGLDLVEILDLVTLNYLEQEVAYIDTGAIPGPDDVKPNSFQSSLIFNLAGDVILGYFGDGYDVIGSLSTPNTCRVRRLEGDITITNGVPEVTQLDVDDVAQDVQGSDYVDLAADQATLFYTSAGRKVKRYNLSTNTQLADFVTLAAEAGPRPGLRGLRLLSPGDGTGGLLVCDGINVKRINGAGAVVQTYTPNADWQNDPTSDATDPAHVPNPRAQDLDKIEVTPAGDAFWVSDQLSTSLFKFDLATGDQLDDLQLDLPIGQLCGFSLYNGYRAGISTPSPVVADAGAEARICGPGTTTLDGSASTNFGLVTFLWEQISGPGVDVGSNPADAAVIATPTTVTTLVTIPAFGVYVFQLTVTKAGVSATATVRIISRDCSIVSLACEGFPLPLVHQYFDQIGEPGHDYKLFTYEPSSSTPLATYHDEALTVPNPNPLILDAAARDTIFVGDGVYYRLEMQDKNGNIIWERDRWRWASRTGDAAPTTDDVQPGSIVLFGGGTVPAGWLLCNGAKVSRTTYANLFAAIGTTFGPGNGASTFTLPDFRQRFPLGVAASGVGSTLGAVDGAIDHVHPGPSHTHPIAAHTHTLAHTHTVPRAGWGGTAAAGVGTAGRALANDGSAPNLTEAQNDTTSGPSSAVNTGAQAVTTNASGTANTGSANPPLLAVSFIIKT